MPDFALFHLPMIGLYHSLRFLGKILIVLCGISGSTDVKPVFRSKGGCIYELYRNVTESHGQATGGLHRSGAVSGTTGACAAEERRPCAAGHWTQAVLYQRRISHRQAAVQQPHQSGTVR